MVAALCTRAKLDGNKEARAKFASNDNSATIDVSFAILDDSSDFSEISYEPARKE